MKRKITFLLVFLNSILYLSYSQINNDVIVKIGDETVTVNEFVSSFQKNNQLSKTTEEELRDYLDLYINFRLKVKEGKALQLDTSSAFRNEFLAYRKQSAQQYLIDKDVSDRLINEAKERMKHYVRASHIMVACDPNASPKDTLIAYNKIMDIRQKVISGEFTFADAAVRFSEDPSARDMMNPNTKRKQPGNKGDLGYFSIFNLVYPFENGAYNTPVDSISMPIRSNFGYHIIYVQDKIDAIENVTVAHIFVADTLAAHGKMSPEAKTKLETIQRDLNEGKSFDEVVMLYTEDQYTKDKAGVMDAFQLPRRPGDFVKAAISLNLGEISQPVATTMGWHIIRLMDIVPQTMSDDEMTYFVKSRIGRDSRSHLSKNSFIEKLKNSYHYTEKNKDKAIKFLAKSIPDNFYTSNEADISSIPKIENLKPMAQFEDQEIAAQDFVTYLNRYRGVNLKEGESKKEFLETHFNGYVAERLTQYEDQRLEAKYSDFKELMDEYKNGMILYEINSTNVWENAIQDSVGLLAFYETVKTDYPVDEPNDSIQYKPIQEIKANVITRYQEYLDEKWVNELKAKYPVTIREEVFKSILKK